MDNSNLLTDRASRDLPQETQPPTLEPSEQLMIDHYRCPQEFAHIGVHGNLSEHAGFFKFGSESVCYGRASGFSPSPEAGEFLNDALRHARAGKGGITLPFDLAETVTALRCEKYVRNDNGVGRSHPLKQLQHAAYYAVRPLMPVGVRKHFQRYVLRNWDQADFPRWPVDTTVESIFETAMRLSLKGKGLQEMPFIWFWPDGAQACALMTHDVETSRGRDFCAELMDIDDSFGIKASFQVVPECRYTVSDAFLDSIRERGFEIGIHDLNHDGSLFSNFEEFSKRVASINRYGREFNSRGFRSAVLYRNIDWFHLLDFDYDMSVPSVAHLEAQRGGCCTTFPYFIGNLLEIPVTMTQDYSLFNILRDYSPELWASQMDMISQKHGVMNVIVHPDYVLEGREQRVYKALLNRLAELRKTAGVWIPLPGEVSQWWRQRSRMKLVRHGGGWEIEGEGKVRARIAYARLENDQLVYSF